MNKDELLQLGYSKLCVNRNCLNCVGGINCEKCNGCTYCYGCIDCTNCYGCVNCTDCVNCDNCINCNGQKNKQYMVENIQLTETEYNDFMIR